MTGKRLLPSVSAQVGSEVVLVLGEVGAVRAVVGLGS